MKGVYNIAEVVFRGELQSDVVCLQCGTTSTTYDPFLDISLHLKTRSNNKSSSEGKDVLYE